MKMRTIICLANSRKPPSGRCIAGKVFENGKVGNWIRPVSARPGREVSEEERRYQEGTKAQLLDIVNVPLNHRSPMDNQVENHIIDDRYYWVKSGVASWKQVQEAVDPHAPAFWANSQSTFHGQNDKVAASNVRQAGSSLKLISVLKVQIVVASESGYEGNPARRRVRARFELANEDYLLSVTDPEVEEKYLQRGDGTYKVTNAALCISLAELWNGCAFRVVASIITPERCKV
jgi:hypothetical protein